MLMNWLQWKWAPSASLCSRKDGWYQVLVLIEHISEESERWTLLVSHTTRTHHHTSKIGKDKKNTQGQAKASFVCSELNYDDKITVFSFQTGKQSWTRRDTWIRKEVGFELWSCTAVRMAEWSKAPDSRWQTFQVKGLLVSEWRRGFKSHFWQEFYTENKSQGLFGVILLG